MYIVLWSSNGLLKQSTFGSLQEAKDLVKNEISETEVSRILIPYEILENVDKYLHDQEDVVCTQP